MKKSQIVQLIAVSFVACAITSSTGCVRRTLSISSEPPGALVWLNDREVGRTPVEVDFLYYGDYDVRLVKDGYEPLHTAGKANPPWWDSIPLDLISEVLPGEQVSRIEWSFTLEPAKNDPDLLLQNAQALRAETSPAEQVPPAE